MIAGLVGGTGLVLAVLWGLGYGASAVRAQGPDGYNVYYVAPGGDCGPGVTPCYETLQAAVDAVDAPDDVIKVAEGVYTGVQGRNSPIAYRGPDVIWQVVYLTKTVTIRGGYAVGQWSQSDPETHPTTLDAEGQGRVFFVTGNISPVIEGLRLMGGDADGLGGYWIGPWGAPVDSGGGLYISESAVVVKDTHVVSNVAEHGGGFYLLSANVTLEANLISRNAALSDGGGVYLQMSELNLQGNTFSLNTAGRDGGGGYFYAGAAVFQDNSLRFNFAERNGGAAYLATLNIQMQGTDVSFNAAMFQGGGLVLSHCSDASLVNNLLTDNWTGSSGSGVYVYASTPRLLHTTIARNRGGDASGLYVSGQVEGAHSVVTLTNTILVSQPVGVMVTTANTVSLEATLWGGGAWANEVDWAGTGTVFTGSHNYWGDPAFVCVGRACAVPYRLGPSSAALDQGLDVGVTVDVDGEARPVGGGYDIGADEYDLAPLPPIPRQERLLLAFYYTWYPLSAWSNPEMLDIPLFPHRSDDTEAIIRHLTWARAAGLDALAVSWWGTDETWLDDNWYKLLQSIAGTDLQAAICFETLSRHFDSPQTVASQIAYVLDTYGTHPNFLKHDGRPVIFLYAVNGIPREAGTTAYQAWQIVVDQLDAGGYHPFLLGDALDPRYLDLFEGLYTYLAQLDVTFYQDISCQAHAAQDLWVSNIYPGYDDHLLDRPYHLYIPRDGGRVYAETFTDALRSNPDWIVVTSFNEWWENTHIEPSVMYGYDYVLQTADMAARFQRWHVLSEVYVDAAHVGLEDGSQRRPFNTLGEALDVVVEGGTVRMAGGVYSGTITVTRSITLAGGYDPVGWKRDVAHQTTVLQGGEQGPVVRVFPGVCTPAPTVLLQDLTVTGGVAAGAHASGGGVHVQDAALRLDQVAISGNHASNHGGGVCAQGHSVLTVQASEIVSNTSSVGGGLFVGDQSKLELVNTFVARNRANLVGGGLYSGPGAFLSVVNSTLTGNRTRDDGSGAYAWSLWSPAAVMTNSIVWGNEGAFQADLECLGECRVAYSDIGGGWAGPGNMDVDPQFYDPAAADYHLSYRSPLVDAGDPYGVQPGGPAPALDIDGDVRPWGMGVDLGADEVGPLDASTLVVDKALALPGERLQYTLTLTHVAQTEGLDFWVTDTLPLLVDYVPGSLQVSTGHAVYTMSVGTGLTGTVWLPQILWAGTLAPGETARLRFAATVRSQSMFDCATIRNEAAIRSTTASLRRDVSTRLAERTLRDIVVQDAAGRQGRPVVTRTLQTGEGLTVYAAGYNSCQDYVGPVTVNWQTVGTLEYQTAVGPRFTFTPTVAGGSGRIRADDGQGHVGQTGQITIVHAPPKLDFFPMALYSQQFLGQRVTRPLTLSNAGGLTLTFEILPNVRVPFYTETVEMAYAWDGGFVVDADNAGQETVWDYFFTSEETDPRLMGSTFRVTEVEVESKGVNLADWINWDLEVHLSDRPIGLPGGQFWNSRTVPWAGYERNAPVQWLLAVGERRDANSYSYHARHNFVTGATTATPFFGYVKDSLSRVLSPTDGLHAQAFFWTGDPRVTVQFDDVQLVVRGVMTRTFPVADWLTVTPVSGTLAPGRVQVITATFDARGHILGAYGTAMTIHSNDPERPLSMIPVTLTVVPGMQLYLPMVIHGVDVR